MKELQERRFKEQIEEILGKDCTIQSNIDQEGTLHSAKVNTTQTLDIPKLNAIYGTADAWCCEFEIAPEAPGLRIKFEINTAAVAALN